MMQLRQGATVGHTFWLHLQIVSAGWVGAGMYASKSCLAVYCAVKHNAPQIHRNMFDPPPLILLFVQACYIRLPPSARRVCEGSGLDFREGVHAASHALLNVLPLFMVCNSNDVGTEVCSSCGMCHSSTFCWYGYVGGRGPRF